MILVGPVSSLSLNMEVKYQIYGGMSAKVCLPPHYENMQSMLVLK